MKHSLRKIAVSLASLAAAVTMLTSALPSANAAAFSQNPGITARAHVQNVGWMPYKSAAATSGVTVGTTGQSLRMEYVNLRIDKIPPSMGGVRIRSHVADIGWLNAAEAPCGTMLGTGTTGQGKAIEAMSIQLVGPIANYFNIEYNLHVQDIGWQGIHRNGAVAGTTGHGKRTEALFVRLRHR